MEEIKLKNLCDTCYYVENAPTLTIISYGKGTEAFHVGFALEKVLDLSYTLGDSSNLPKHKITKNELLYFQDMNSSHCYTLNQIREIEVSSVRDITIWTHDDVGYNIKGVGRVHIFCGKLEFDGNGQFKVSKSSGGVRRVMSDAEVIRELKNGKVDSPCTISKIYTVGLFVNESNDA